jgi:hypothetical protein
MTRAGYLHSAQRVRTASLFVHALSSNTTLHGVHAYSWSQKHVTFTRRQYNATIRFYLYKLSLVVMLQHGLTPKGVPGHLWPL